MLFRSSAWICGNCCDVVRGFMTFTSCTQSSVVRRCSPLIPKPCLPLLHLTKLSCFLVLVERKHSFETLHLAFFAALADTDHKNAHTVETNNEKSRTPNRRHLESITPDVASTQMIFFFYIPDKTCVVSGTNTA